MINNHTIGESFENVRNKHCDIGIPGKGVVDIM